MKSRLAKGQVLQRSIVLAGDSWAAFTCTLHSIDDSLKNAGVVNAATNASCNATTLIGMHAEDWLKSNFHKATLVSLQDPSVQILYLSLGGNDLINMWNRSMSLDQENEMSLEIKKRLNDIVTVYQALRPDIKILISGYDFPRFTPDHPILAYRKAYLQMGSPSALELNTMLMRFSKVMTSLANGKNVFYIHHLGVMQYYFGNSEGGLEPLSTLNPDFISPANQPERGGGAPELLTAASAMLSTEGVVDAFHLSRNGYDKLADHSVRNYIKAWLQ